MKNNPLISHLEALSRKEMTRFADFAASPYFNKHKDVRALVALLSEIYPEFTDKKCARSVLFQRLYPGKQHQQPQLAVIFSYTLRLLEDFFIVESLDSAGRLRDKTLYFKQLRKRNLTSLLKLDLENEQPKTGKSIHKTTTPNAADKLDFEQKFKIAAEQDAISLSLGVSDLAHLEEKQRYLDAFYLIEKLRDACEINQRSRLLKALPPKEPILEAICILLFENPDLIEAAPPIKVYFQLYNLLNHNDLDKFHACLATVQQYERSFEKEELQGLFNYLQNCCIEQINRGNQAYLREIFRLYQLQLENQLLVVDGVLPEWHYKNIVTTGLRLDERAWVRDFIENYRQQLSPSVADNAYSYNLATYYYHVGKPKDVLPLLLQVEYTDLRYNLDAKSLLLRTYFDLAEEEALLAHAEAFGQFVKRNKSLTEFQKKGYFNLIRFAQKLFKLKMQDGFLKADKWNLNLSKLKTDFEAAETVFNRSWLEAKLQEININSTVNLPKV